MIDCLYCGKKLDAAIDITSVGAPKEGDASLCFYCCSVSIFTGDGLDKRKPTADELIEILADSGVQYYIAKIKQAKSGLS